jgi:hypothetical protein
MSEDKKDLLTLVDFVIDIANLEGNEWFKSKLIDKLTQNEVKMKESSIYEIHNDLKRTKLYLKKIDKLIYQEAFNFYKIIGDSELKNILINEYKEMKLSLELKDYLEYSRRLIVQLETCFDYTIEKLDAWEIILNDISKYHEIKYISGIYENSMKIKDKFFKIDFFSKEQIRQELSKIDFKAKALFCISYYDINPSKDFSNLSDVYFIRNQASHGKTSTKDKIKLQGLISRFDEKNIYIWKMFNSYIKCLKILN